MYYRINSPNVVREYFDGEVVVVNLETGTYFSLENISALIWAHLEDGLSVSESAARIGKTYGRSEAESQAIIENFVKNLLEQELLVGLSQAPGKIADSLAAQINVNPAHFGEATIKKYTDMQDLLLLDPIHDADEAGWPAPKPQDLKVAD